MQLSLDVFSVVENTPLGTTIGRIQASDRDVGTNGRITYTMADNMHFEVDTNNGTCYQFHRFCLTAVRFKNFASLKLTLDIE